jgi:hypothetical protein
MSAQRTDIHRARQARGPPTNPRLRNPFLHGGTRVPPLSLFSAGEQALPFDERIFPTMKHLLVLPEYVYAGHCTSGGSNKVWAACLAVEIDEQQTIPPPVGETTEVVYLSVWGRHGSNLSIGAPKQLPMKNALKLFTGKCREKDGEAYVHVAFAPFLSAFGRPLGLALVAAEGVGQRGGGEPSASQGGQMPSSLGYVACNVRAIDERRLRHMLADPGFGITEKVNGERCLIRSDGQELVAYNRKGQQMSAPPVGAFHLLRLGCPFVIDGERLTGELGGHYVAFDLLEWGAEPYTAYPYSQRILTLVQALLQDGLSRTGVPTPTHLLARANSTVTDLALLASVSGAEQAARTLEAVRASSGEGVVLRNLSGDYATEPFKFKFTSDIDAFVISVNEGLSGGSLKLGLVRHTDGAVICVGNVRAGLTEANIASVGAMLAAGQRPVFTVTYLPKRTVGIQLVEPTAGMTMLRTDKDPAECTTEQFGAEKAEFIAQAVPVSGISL